jgi:hypothetical protein
MSTLGFLALCGAGVALILLLRSHGATSQGGLPPNQAPSIASPADARSWTARELRHRCGAVNLTSDRYGSHVYPHRGKPGKTVVVTGTTFRGEDGRFFPSNRLEVWWNTRVPASEVPAAKPLKPGAIIHLATVDNMQRCRFRNDFTVPNVRPGTYKVLAFIFYEGGYGWFGVDHFRVTAPN